MIDSKVERVFSLKAKKSLTELDILRSKLEEKQSDFLTSEELSLLRLKIEELEKYLELFKETCRTMDLDLELGLKKEEIPKMIV